MKKKVIFAFFSVKYQCKDVVIWSRFLVQLLLNIHSSVGFRRTFKYSKR